MGLHSLQKAFELIEEYGGDFDGLKAESLIEKAEEALSIKFPPTFRQFLSTYGCGDIEGLEFYGLTNDNFISSSVPNAIWLNLTLRKSGLPNNLILVYSTGDGNYIALNTSVVDENCENPVVLVTPNGDILENVSSDYGDFLFTELQTVI